MTYDKLGTGEAPFAPFGFNECVYTKQNTGVLVRSVSGPFVSPTQLFAEVDSDRIASGWALRLQSTTIEFDASLPLTTVVRFTGECSRPYVRNESSGKEFFVRQELAVGEELVIDMNRHRVTIDGELAFGYTGRWFDVLPGDVLKAGAAGIGPGFTAEVDVLSVGGLITKPAFGMGASERKALGRPQLTVARTGTAAKVNAGSAGRNGVGAGKSPRVASGTAEKKRDYS